MPPSYTVRESRRAKHVSLKVSPDGSLEVVIPPGFDRKRIPAIVQKKQRWINQVMTKVENQKVDHGVELPMAVELQAIAQTWTIHYQETPLRGIRIAEQPNQQLTLLGEISDTRLCKTALQRWIASKARVYLLPWLRSVSQEVALPYTDATIRQQRTRWGSCTSRHTISLNSKLLFLPTAVVRYVFVHELCHTIHLNHSKQFWALVGEHETDYRHLDDRLRDARYLVPLWMEET
jgi:predicted metal-dependent hydrolase